MYIYIYIYIGGQNERQHEPGPGKFVGAEGMAKFDSAEKGPVLILKSQLYRKKKGEKRKKARHELSILKSQLCSGFILQVYQVTDF
jgi:hypothetical protein